MEILLTAFKNRLSYMRPLSKDKSRKKVPVLASWRVSCSSTRSRSLCQCALLIADGTLSACRSMTDVCSLRQPARGPGGRRPGGLFDRMSVLTLTHPLQVGEGTVGKGFPQVQHFNGGQHTQRPGWGLLPKSLGLQGIPGILGPDLQSKPE